MPGDILPELRREQEKAAIIQKAVDAVVGMYPNLKLVPSQYEIRRGSAARIGDTGPEIRIQRVEADTSAGNTFDVGIESDGRLTDEHGKDLGIQLTQEELGILGVKFENEPEQ